ncbi:SatD family protein [Gulosibacter sp. ACHW.36C]|uniref:SatD family protein n=1 Tax=Gulosibacter sediminis TaxID=1729695 RepID=A0ABY4MYZ5_9MICO|nr:SatD family protein [Gulosibacter sediminis]UQN15297.1 SatD family protein [Gulosibacter sediminis]
MSKMKANSSCVALLVDIVDSRGSDRSTTHAAILAALPELDSEAALEPVHPTVGDELQGIFRTLGAALTASYHLRLLLDGAVELRFGLGGGEVRVIDEQRNIQDGSAWWRAREAIEAVETLESDPQYPGIRTGIVDGRSESNSLAPATAQLVDAQLARLRVGARHSLRLLLDGLDNQRAAEAIGISASANSQRVRTNQLRILADTMLELGKLD